MSKGSKSVMLGLQLPTDPRWVKLVESNIHEVLTDHAWCMAISTRECMGCSSRYHETQLCNEESTNNTR